MKDLTVEPVVMVIQDLWVVIFQKGKRMMFKMVNEKKESVANNFADLKKLSPMEKHQNNVISILI